ncbi:MAG: hypothetical protein LIP01_14320 [Tannerellaceae bacterium]|nr:hypothetical protein [Tannerellaceae bacterium]
MTLIRRDKEDNGYYRLQEQTLDSLQKFSGKVWTDYNEHDPGITIADVFNYALFELEYQLHFQPECYLRKEKKDQWKDIGLLPPDKLFDRIPVSTADYENLICEFFPEVKRCKVIVGEDLLYHITIDTEEEPAGKNLADEVNKFYHQHRNLGENLGTVTLAPVTGKKKQGVSDLLAVHWQSPVTREKTDLKIPLFDSLLPYFPGCYELQKESKTSRQLKEYLSLYDTLLKHISGQVRDTGKMLQLPAGENTP